MKAKKEFYHFGNDRRFNDHYTISIMTGEPMPRKWQAFFDMTPEEKARWDASLKLDEEYRIAEAQGFPNGIPGGRERGNILYDITQREEEYKRNMQEETLQGQSFLLQKTEMQTNRANIPNNTQIYRQNSLLQANASIEKEPTFNEEQAKMSNGMSEKEYVYPIQRPCTDIKKAPYANVQKMLYVNKENERYRPTAFEKDSADDAVYNWDSGDASDHDEMRYQQYANDSLGTYWLSGNRNFNNTYPPNGDSKYMFTTNGADAYMQFYGPAFVEDISAIMKEWGSAYNKWVDTLTKEEEVAFGLLTEIVQDVAEELVARAPNPYFRIGGAVVLMGLSIYQSAKAVEEEWYTHVRQKMKDDSCSQEEAEKRSIPWLITLICLEMASRKRKSWLEDLLKEIDTPISARRVIMQDWGKVIIDLTGIEPGVEPMY